MISFEEFLPWFKEAAQRHWMLQHFESQAGSDMGGSAASGMPNGLSCHSQTSMPPLRTHAPAPLRRRAVHIPIGANTKPGPEEVHSMRARGAKEMLREWLDIETARSMNK